MLSASPRWTPARERDVISVTQMDFDKIVVLVLPIYASICRPHAAEGLCVLVTTDMAEVQYVCNANTAEAPW
jgi:hypothetical protein